MRDRLPALCDALSRLADRGPSDGPASELARLADSAGARLLVAPPTGPQIVAVGLASLIALGSWASAQQLRAPAPGESGRSASLAAALVGPPRPEGALELAAPPRPAPEPEVAEPPPPAPEPEPAEPPRRPGTPAVFKGIYLSFWSASVSSRVDEAVRLARAGLINTVVIDIKDAQGRVGFDTRVPQAVEYRSRERVIKDLGALVGRLHSGGLHVAARMVMFNDPHLARARPELAVHSKALLGELGAELSPETLWQDERKLRWVDPGSREAWDYNIAIAKDALARGVDEINIDYVRFPSGGALSDMHLPVSGQAVSKRDVIRGFFSYLRAQLPGARLSADLFGLVTVAEDDLSIGQVIEDALPYFDAICPMVYPSHYADGFLDLDNPAEHPYEVVHFSLSGAHERLRAHFGEAAPTAALIPWLQDFNIGAEYDTHMVREQVRAVVDALGEDYRGFLLWSPKNRYSTDALR